jgi:flagellar protein FliO/FliZ
MEMSWAILKMILSLGAILLGLFFLTRLMKRCRMTTGGASSGSGVRVLATHRLAPQKYLSLVEIGGEVLALGISETQIALLTKIDNKEFIERISNPTDSKQEAVFSLDYLPPFFTRPKGIKGGWLRRVYGK